MTGSLLLNISTLYEHIKVVVQLVVREKHENNDFRFVILYKVSKTQCGQMILTE